MSYKSAWEAKKSFFFRSDTNLTVSRPGAGVANLNPSESEPFSVSLWFYDISDYNGTLIGNSTTNSWTTAEGWNIKYGSNQLRFWLGDGSGSNYIVRYFSFANYSRLQWNHFVMTYDGSSTLAGLKGYYNNSEVLWDTNQTSGTLSGIDSSADIKMGTGGAYDDFWTGRMSNVAFWSKTLTGAEVGEIYRGRNGDMGPGDLNRHSAQANLVSWWLGDNPSDTYNGTIHDNKGSFNATPTGDGLTDGDLGYSAP